MINLFEQDLMENMRDDRMVYCSKDEMNLFRIPRDYHIFDLLDINDFFIYSGIFRKDEVPIEQVQKVDDLIEEGLQIFKDIENFSCLTGVVKENSVLYLDCAEYPFQEKYKQYLEIIKVLKEESCQIRRNIFLLMTKGKIAKVFPNYLSTLLSLYFQSVQDEEMYSIAHFSLFLADFIQMEYPLTETEKISFQTLFSASQNCKFPLRTRKHLSLSFFDFFSSLPDLIDFPLHKDLLLTTFSKN